MLLRSRQLLSAPTRTAVACVRGMATKHSTALLSVQEAMEMARNTPVKFADASWHLDSSRNAQDEFIKERIAGAVRFDIDDLADISSPLPHMLPSKSDFTEKAQLLGLNRTDHVIVYCTPGAFSAARAWWMCNIFGIENVSILNGGLAAWKRAGGKTESGEPSPVARGDIVASFNKDLVVDAGQVLSVVQTGSSQICDARGAPRFNGEVAEPRAGLISGHIPGSLNIPHTAFLEDSDPTTYKSIEEIRAVVDDAGLIPGARTITTCGSGVTASTISFSLYRLGWSLSQVPVYDGSWSEWGRKDRVDLPKVEKEI